MHRARVFTILFCCFLARHAQSRLRAQSLPWIALEPGLDLCLLQSPRYLPRDSAYITILKIDPNRFEFKLLNSSAPDQEKSLSARDWCGKENMVAAINASMYQTDYKKSVSYMRTQTHINNSRLSRDKTILAFDARTVGFPQVKIIDRGCESFDIWKPRYQTFIQSIRMISCEGTNVWSNQPREWSLAAIGTDTKDAVLFIHAEAPHTVHDFVNILLASGLSISRAMYVEGGSEAQLYAKSGSREIDCIGQYTGGGGKPSIASSLPNVIGVSRRK